MLSRTKTLLATCTVGCLASAGFAEFYNFVDSGWVDEPGASGWAWESFSNANYAPNFADDGWYGDGTHGGPYDAELYNFSGSAILASSGNLYDPGGALNIHIYGGGDVDMALLQFSAMGTPMDTMGIEMYVSGSAGDMYFGWDDMVQTYYEEIPGMGAIEQYALSWDISDDYAGEVFSWGFFMSSYGPHTSLDSVALEVMAIPAPGAIALLGFAGMTARRRRK